MAFPTKGIELVVPSAADLAIGEPWGCNFHRRGHDYAVSYHRSGLVIRRDGEPVRRWDDLPAAVQRVITRTRDVYAATFVKAAADAGAHNP